MSEEIIQLKIFKNGHNDTEIVSKISTDIYFRGREKFYKDLYGDSSTYKFIKSFADKNNIKLPPIVEIMVSDTDIIRISGLSDDATEILESNVVINNHLNNLQIVRISIDGHYSTWCLILETFENRNGETYIKYKDNYNYFYEEVLPMLRDRILNIYNITDDNIYISWVGAKDAIEYNKSTNGDINIKDLKED